MIQPPSTSHDPRYVILVAVTFDKPGVHALSEAARLAQLHPNSVLHVVHVAPEHADSGPRRRSSRLRPLQLSPAELQEYVRQACPAAPAGVVAHVRVGLPSRAILRTAAEINAELVVIGEDRRPRARKPAASVAQQVFQHAHCPVFIAMPKAYTAQPVARAVETACPRCQDARQRTYGEQLWCEKHERLHARRRKGAPELQLPDRMHYHP
jgi:nucleotide-binding universal stress UspA family protein